MAILHAGSVATPKPEIAAAVREFVPEEDRFIADAVLPMFDAKIQTGTIPVVKRDDALRIVNTKRAPAADFARVDFREEGMVFNCEGYGLEFPLADETRLLYATAFDAEEMAGQMLRSLLYREREARVAAAILNGTTWTGATLTTDVSGSGPWATVGTDVVTQVNGAIEKVVLNSGLLPNALVMNTTNVNRLLANTVIRARFPGAPKITRQMLVDALAEIFGIETLIEGAAVKNSAIEGQAHVGAYIWSSTYVQVARVVKKGAPITAAGLGRTMKQGNLMGGSADMNMLMYREQKKKADILQADWYLDELIFGAAYAHMLKVA